MTGVRKDRIILSPGGECDSILHAWSQIGAEKRRRWQMIVDRAAATSQPSLSLIVLRSWTENRKCDTTLQHTHSWKLTLFSFRHSFFSPIIPPVKQMKTDEVESQWLPFHWGENTRTKRKESVTRSWGIQWFTVTNKQTLVARMNLRMTSTELEQPSAKTWRHALLRENLSHTVWPSEGLDLQYSFFTI